AGLELLAALVERLHATGHRVLDGRCRIDCEQDREGRDGAQHRRDPDHVEAEEVQSGRRWGLLHVRSVPHQISKLTILAMIRPPMLIQIMAPIPATIRRWSVKKPPMYLGFIK